MAIELPVLNPNIITIGNFGIKYYSLAYIFGIVLAWIIIRKFSKYQNTIDLTNKKITDDFFFYTIIGIIAGGRIGYILFYNINFFLYNPMEILYIWHGGMSFHGGLIGILISTYYFCKKNNVELFKFYDLMAIAAPIGLFLGRIANFINMELYGKQTDVAWAMIFPFSDMQPRHPSQLYEATLEGLVLFTIILFITLKTRLKTKGLNSGVFLILYSCFRFFIEFFREPDIQIGYVLKYFTMGQILCLPMLFSGIYIILFLNKKNKNF